MTRDFRVRRPLTTRIRADRRVAGIAALGLLTTVLAPTLTAGPAAAAPCDAKPFIAGAQADLLKAKVLDLRPLGSDAPPLADVTVSSAASVVNSTAKRKSAAQARYLDAKVLGENIPAGPLNAVATQVAPPHHEKPKVVAPAQLDAELLRVGTGHLLAHAKWKPGFGCHTAAGVMTESYGSDLDAAVLPLMTTKESGEAPRAPGGRQLGDALAALPSNAFSQTATTLKQQETGMATQAIAWIGLSHLVLFGGTDHKTTIKVISPPELKGIATGTKRTSSVTYQAPILEITGPDGQTHRIDSPSQMFELTLPPSAPPTVTEKRAEDGLPDSGLPSADVPGDIPGSAAPPGSPKPDRSGDALDNLLGELTGSRSGPHKESTSESGGRGGGGAMAAPADSMPTLTLRVAIGHLESTVTKTSVRGGAASLRLQLLSSGPRAATATSGAGDRDVERATIADVALGLLEVRATAPHAGGPTAPPATSPPPTSGGGGGALPTTGFNLLAVLATGALLLVIGRFLMVVSRRRETASATEGLET
ncbi:MAG: hypothetical protein GEU94_05005 [Micromonosporaceae bacterium]|nr:hypothetical protein [Micromonosporaceae bacterium]